jgi:Domain of unknown function (DUF1906)
MATREGVDYSFSPPKPAELKAAGKTFACRYVGTPESAKNLTVPEAQALQAAGIDIVSNYEAGNAGWMLGGGAAGERAARLADADTKRLGIPPGRPIYFSCDFNATYDQWKNGVKPCLQGIASVIGWNRTGMYGGLFQLDWAHKELDVHWLWQALGWRYGQWSPHALIQQYNNSEPLGSGTVDFDRAMVADFGQWKPPKEQPDMTDAEHQVLFDIQQRVSGLDELASAVAALGGKVKDIQARVLTNDEALSAIYAALRLVGADMRARGVPIPVEVFAALPPANAVSAELQAAVTGPPPTP